MEKGKRASYLLDFIDCVFFSKWETAESRRNNQGLQKRIWTLCLWNKLSLSFRTESSEPETFFCGHQNTKPALQVNPLSHLERTDGRKQALWPVWMQQACSVPNPIGSVWGMGRSKCFNCAGGRLKFLELWWESQKQCIKLQLCTSPKLKSAFESEYKGRHERLALGNWMRCKRQRSSHRSTQGCVF